ncbi:helix-turn-helix domain-containing protein [Curtobacterium flaccumfaciens]|uniref:helix-turn-helix transcriptional regulator n=1 Tax=Curtobacterium flaccumfaciens TaxID=2035 RepID=UPI00217CCD6E|nr:helix-turn-helix transcriptional regulator [Curtobacterium flaccumfaciens]MCS6559089.1 helix-turn-helix domain-containing protein [Curtobacterium flaccumfaciens]
MALSDLFARVRASAEYRRASHNARANREMLNALVRMRIASGLKQSDMAKLLGMSQQAVSKFERYDNDPKVSTVERYAGAVGALVSHSVDPDVGQLEHGEVRVRSYIAFVDDERAVQKDAHATYAVGAPRRTHYAMAA